MKEVTIKVPTFRIPSGKLPDMRGRLSVRAWSFAALVAVVVIAAVVTTVVLVKPSRSGLPAGSAFKVDGQVITVDALNRRIAVLSALYSIQKPTDPAKLATFKQDAAKSMAVSIILADEANREGITITPAQAQASLQKVIASGQLGTQAKYDAFIKANGLSNADVLAEVTRVMESSALYTKVTASVPQVTDAQAQADYNAHKADMVSPAERTIRNIVVKTQAEANTVLSELQSGSSFSALAGKVSIDASTRTKGGMVGTVAQSDLDAAYGTAAFNASTGAFFGPVQTNYGWNVGQVTAVLAPQPVTYAQAKTTLIRALTDKAQLTVWTAWLVNRIKAAGVVYDPTYRPADPNAAPGDVTTGQ